MEAAAAGEEGARARRMMAAGPRMDSRLRPTFPGPQRHLQVRRVALMQRMRCRHSPCAESRRISGLMGLIRPGPSTEGR